MASLQKLMSTTKAFLFFALTLLSLSGCDCNKTKPPVNAPPDKPVATVTPPDFNADSAYVSTQTQVDFGPRIPGTPAQTKCAAYFERFFKRLTPNVVVQDVSVPIYNGKQVPCKNIIASFNPENPKRILLFAHWDTRPFADRDSAHMDAKFDGADDGAAASAILMEIARLLKDKPANVGIDIALFDVEDYGPPSDEPKWDEKDQYALGTQYWCKHPHVPNYRAYYGVLLDMAAAKNARFLIEGVTQQYAPSVAQQIWNTASSLGYGNFFINEFANPIIDDHYYVNTMNGTPCVDIIYLDKSSATGFAPHWHTTLDNMNIVSRETMKAVGQTLLQVIYNEQPQG